MALSTIDTSSISALGYGFKNRIINGDMRIDQRNAGASVTPANFAYTLDRWRAVQSTSAYSVDQNAASVTPPTGFTNYLGITSLAATTLGATDVYAMYQPIEGFNVADFNFGSVSAVTVTLSFWVRSSLTGTFGGKLSNSAGNRNYPFSYSVSAANTWELKTVSIAGDTSGTWLTDNGIGLNVSFGLGAGASRSGTAGAWTSSDVWQPTGAVSVVGTSGATFYITGVQLEKGTVATAFDYRDYGRELMMCQRYYWQLTNFTPTVGVYRTTTVLEGTQVSWPVSMRTPITCALPSLAGLIFVNGGATAITGAPSVGPSGANSVFISLSSAAQPQNAAAWANITSTLTISAEL
jgi:hypothetical protein